MVTRAAERTLDRPTKKSGNDRADRSVSADVGAMPYGLAPDVDAVGGTGSTGRAPSPTRLVNARGTGPCADEDDECDEDDVDANGSASTAASPLGNKAGSNALAELG